MFPKPDVKLFRISLKHNPTQVNLYRSREQAIQQHHVWQSRPASRSTDEMLISEQQLPRDISQ